MSKQYPLTRATTIRRKVIIVEETVLELPTFMKHLALFCTRHPIPQPMCFSREEVSHDNQLLAEYRCADPHCNHREQWAQDHNGRPYKVRATAVPPRHQLPYL